MYNTCERISLLRGTPFHQQFPQPSEEVLEESVQGANLPAQNKTVTTTN